MKDGIKIEGYSGYEIFPEEGTVFSLKRNRFVGAQHPNGYWYVGLTDDNGKVHHFLLHRVIWTSVYGEIPEGLDVNHIDEDKSNNSISNLNLMTRKENINYGSRNQTVAEKLTNGVTSKQVGAYKDGILVMTFPSTMEAGRQGYNSGNVSACCRNCFNREGNNTFKGYQWKYFN